MERIGNHIEPYKQYRMVACFLIGIDQLSEKIGDQHLFGKTQYESSCAFGRRCNAVFPCAELFCNIGIPHDRASDQLREQCDISCKIDRILLCGSLSSININRIAENLEGIEADADGERDPQQRNRHSCDGVPVLDKEVGILKVTKYAETQYRSCRKTELCRGTFLMFLESRNQQTKDIALKNRRSHYDEVSGFAPSVEQQAGT